MCVLPSVLPEELLVLGESGREAVIDLILDFTFFLRLFRSRLCHDFVGVVSYDAD